MSFFFLDEWSIKKITVLFLTRNEDHQKIKKNLRIMKNVHLEKMKCRQWLFITVRLKTVGKRIFVLQTALIFKLTGFLRYLTCICINRKQLLLNRFLKINFFTKVRFSFNESNDDCDVIGLFPWCIWNIWNVGKEKMWAKRECVQEW